MKKKEIQELKNKPVAELTRMAHDKAEELRTLRFDLAAGKVKDISKIREARKAIARVKTVLRDMATNK
jgi:large subunit ribosomal protein L29